MLEERIYIDIEVYRGYFLLSALQHNTGKVVHFEMYEGKPLNLRGIRSLMNTKQTVSFNGLGYDLPVIVAACSGYTNQALKNLSDRIITSGQPIWAICRDQELNVPSNWDHIDLIEVAPGQASLKIYGGRLNAPKLQDLPIHPSDSITPELRELMRTYCINDLETTKLLCDKLEKEIVLREQMSKEYGTDLRSKGGAQVAKAVLAAVLSKQGVSIPRGRISANKKIKYKDPGFFSFNDEKLKSVFKAVLDCDFIVGDNGQVKIPDEISKAIEFDGAKYKFGIGGLHSQESKVSVEAGNDHLLFEKDVASMYPNIILGQNLYPKQLGKKFSEVYGGIVKRRLAAKKAGDKSTSESLKLVINSSFGLFGSKYAYLYSPDLMIQTTITGQLALLMLVERITEIGAKVVSANTDGVVVKCEKGEQYQQIEEICFDWEMDTTLVLEETRYQSIHSQSVNNYISICDDGSVKRKGCFAGNSLSKNPAMVVCYDAVVEWLKNRTPIEQYIRNCKDVTKFVTVRQVKGGAVWNNEEIGKAVRFYYSNGNVLSDTIRYKTNGNKVPKSEGSTPLMQLPETLPVDIDYSRYINEAETILKSVGIEKC